MTNDQKQITINKRPIVFSDKKRKTEPHQDSLLLIYILAVHIKLSLLL